MWSPWGRGEWGRESRLTVSNETRVLIDCLVKIIDMVFPLKGWNDVSPLLILALTSCARFSTSLTSSADQSSM